jgi:hypothetical protein
MKQVSPVHGSMNSVSPVHAWKDVYARPSMAEHGGNPAGPASVNRLRRDAVSLPITTSVDTCSCDGGCTVWIFC